MYSIDDQERKIIRELIRDPRISDNQIAAKTQVPLKTVNRKRKILEEKDLLSYYCHYDNSQEGSQSFQARSMFITILRDGITRKQVVDSLEKGTKSLHFYPKHIYQTSVGEFEGKVAVIMIIESHRRDDLIEIYNAEIVPELKSSFGDDVISKTLTLPITNTLRLLNNYVPARNMSKGKIKEDWPSDAIFIDD